MSQGRCMPKGTHPININLIINCFRLSNYTEFVIIFILLFDCDFYEY